MAYKAAPIKERFEQKFIINEESGCWEWIAAKDKSGYGKFSIGHSHWEKATRISYEIYKG